MAIEVRNVYRCADVVGTAVKARDGDEIGRIEEVAIDLECNELACAALSFGGFPGIGTKRSPFPGVR